MVMTGEAQEFDELMRLAAPRLRRALVGAVGIDRVDDAVAEALAWASEHQAQLLAMENPIGYLYRIGQRHGRRAIRTPPLLAPAVDAIPEIEPGLVDALRALPRRQRVCIWLAIGCQWTHSEIAEALNIRRSTVGTHVARGLESLKTKLLGGYE